MYRPRALNFNGTSDYLSKTADLTGNADGKTGIVSAWFKVADNNTNQVPISNTLESIAWWLFNNKFSIYAKNAANGVILNIATTTEYKTSSLWHHYLCSYDLATTTVHIYVDDADDKGVVSTLVNDTIDYTKTTWAIGASAGGTRKFYGGLAEVYFAPNQYLDFSVEANRRKFISASGKPVPLGPTGAFPTGTAPLIYMDMYGNGTNRGTGGAFTKNGAPASVVGPVTYAMNPALQ